jgi:membrane glycosyltransferase
LQGNPGLPGERGEAGPRVSKLVEAMNSHKNEKVHAQHFDVYVTSDSAILQPGFS